MTIGKKLFSWFMVPVILALVLGIITFVNLRTIDNNIKLLINEDWKRVDSNMEFGSKHTQKILA
jgi:CHASE3 domain sensor protein